MVLLAVRMVADVTETRNVIPSLESGFLLLSRFEFKIVKSYSYIVILYTILHHILKQFYW